jgi:WD40 repeat protein
MTTQARWAPFEWVVNGLFGFDVFISYGRDHPGDRPGYAGERYAAGLKDALEKSGVRCCIDREQFAGGEGLGATTLRNLRRSSTLVLVATPKVFHSFYVQDEVAEMSRLGRPVIPIDVKGALASGDPQERARLIGDRIWIDDLDADDGPSQGAVDRLLQSLRITRQQVRRMRILFSTAVTMAGLAVMAGVLAFIAHRASLAEREARIEAERRLYSSSVVLASTLIDQGRCDLAIAQLWNAPESLRRWEWGHLLGRCHPQLVTFRGTGLSMHRLRFDDEGQRLVGTAFDGVAVWDVPSARLLREFPCGKCRLGQAYIDRTARVVVAETSDGTLVRWDLETGRELGRAPLPSRDAPVPPDRYADPSVLQRESAARHNIVWPRNAPPWLSHSAVSARGDRIMTVASSGDLELWDGRSGARVAALGAVDVDGLAPFFSPSGKLLAGVMSGQDALRLWDASTGKVRATVEGRYLAAAFDPHDALLATYTATGVGTMRDAATGQPLFELGGLGSPPIDVSFDPRGELLAAASKDGTVTLLNARPLQSVAIQGFSGAELSPGAFDGNGKRLVAWSWQDVAIVDLGTPPVVQRLGKGTSVGARLCETGALMMVTIVELGHHSLGIWDAGQVQLLTKLSLPTHDVRSSTFDPSCERVASGSPQGEVVLWDARRGTVLGRFIADAASAEHERFIEQLSFDHSGTHLASVSKAGIAKLWSLEAEVRELARFDGIRAVGFGHDDQFLYLVDKQNRAHAWNLRRSEKVRIENALPSKPLLIVDNGPRFANWLDPFAAVLGPGVANVVRSDRIGYPAEGMILYDGIAGKETARLHGHAEQINDAAFSPDGSRILTASKDGTVKLWDPSNADVLLTLRSDGGDAVHGIQFSPAGEYLAAGAGEPRGDRIEHNRVLIWQAYPWRMEDLPGDAAGDWRSRFELWMLGRYRTRSSTRPDAALDSR